MFEFHGWATIHADDSEDPSGGDLEIRERDLTKKIQDAIREVEAVNREFHLHRMNGTLHLVFCGDHNHFDESILGFFRRLSLIAPHSYGKLHVRDDEDSHGFNNTMRQWTLARGRAIESIDQSMSPCIPTLEAENP